MPEISGAELDDLYAFAVQLGKDAGDLMMKYARSRWSSGGSAEYALTEKDSSVDIVTKADEGKSRNTIVSLTISCFVSQQLLTQVTDIEAFIKTAIEKSYPSHK